MRAVSRITPITLEGCDVVLEPLGEGHVAGLVSAAAGDRSTFTFTTVPEPDEASVRAYVDTALALQAAGTALPFATVRRADGAVVGSTRFLNIEFWAALGGAGAGAGGSQGSHPDAVEIGSTWLNAAAQRTPVNTEAKLLMLAHAFDVWRVWRVCLKTDERNARSRANIERIGARFEGVLRNHMYAADGGVRNTAYYSITLEEWPGVAARLRAKIASYPRP
jgi:RimJ/RimL family protein N-acetyltransferase